MNTQLSDRQRRLVRRVWRAGLTYILPALCCGGISYALVLSELIPPPYRIACAAVFLVIASGVVLFFRRLWAAIAGVSLILPLLGWLPPSTIIESPELFYENRCGHNLDRIGKALVKYRAEHGTLPPAYVADKNGKPMYSWRVLLLPFLGYEDLYNQYHLDEPWDGPHNRALGECAVEVYSCPSSKGKQKSNMTSYVAIVGSLPWPGLRPYAGSLSDLSSGKIVVTEVANAEIPWSAPQDLCMSTMSMRINTDSGQGISSYHATRIVFCLCGWGSVRAISDIMASNGVDRFIERGPTEECAGATTETPKNSRLPVK